MKNYEAIKTMSLEEMAAMLYMFVKPFMEFLNMTAEQKDKMRKHIREFLAAEVKRNET